MCTLRNRYHLIIDIVSFGLIFFAIGESASSKTLTTRETQPKNVDYYGDELPSAAVARCGTSSFSCNYNAKPLAFSADGHLLAVEGKLNDVVLWNVQTGREYKRLIGTTGKSLCLIAFSPNKKFIAATDVEDNVWFWNLSNTNTPRLLSVNVKPVRALAFSTDSKLLASASAKWPSKLAKSSKKKITQLKEINSEIRIWDVQSGKVLRNQDVGNEHICCLTFLGSDGLLAAGSMEGSIWFYHTNNVKEARRLHLGTEAIRQLCADQQGRILSALINDHVWLWEIPTERQLPVPPGTQTNVIAHGMSADGNKLVARKKSQIHIYNLRGGMESKKIDCEDSGWPETMVFSRNGEFVAEAIPRSEFVHVWELSTGKEPFARPGHIADVVGVGVLPEQKTAVSIGVEGQVRWWELSTGKPLGSFSFPKAICPPKLSSNGDYLAITSEVGGCLCQASTGKNIWSWKGRTIGVAFSLQGDRLAIAESLKHDKSAPRQGPARITSSCIRLVNVLTRQTVFTFDEVAGDIKDIVFSPNGKLLASGGDSLRIWDTTSGKLVRTIGKSKYGIKPLCFTSDGLIAVVETRELQHSKFDEGWVEVISLWDPTTGAHCQDKGALSTFVGQSHDGNLLALRCDSGIIVREWPSWKKIGILNAGHVKSVAFSPDSMLCITGCSGGSVVIWDLARAKQESKKNAIKLNDKDLHDLWVALGDELRVESAIDSLVEAPEQCLPYLKKRLHAISDRSAEKWITKLDSGVYAEREQAMQELSKLEFAVLAPIKVRLKETTSSEFKARAAKLLLDLDNPLLEWRCQWSALGILEQIGNSEARDLLQALCLGAAEAKLTKLAQATLLRMKK